MNAQARLLSLAVICLQHFSESRAEASDSLATVRKADLGSPGVTLCRPHSLIAAGIPARPAQSVSMPQAPAIEKNSPKDQTGQPVTPPARSTPVIEENKQNSDSTKPTAKATVEYNESAPSVEGIPPLGVVQALNEALINSPRAAAIRAQFAIARANYATATQVPNPIFFMDRGLLAEQVMRIGPVLTLEPPWKLVFRLLATKRLVAQTKTDLLTTLWQLRADTRRAYMEVIVAQETLETLEQLYALSSKLLFVTEKRFRAGDVPELDMLRARLANSQTVVDLGVGRVRLIRARQQLNIIMGRPVHSPINVPGLPDYTGSVPAFERITQLNEAMPNFEHLVPPLRDYIAIGLENRLELKSLAQQIKLNQINLKGAYGNSIPNTSLALGKSSEGNPTPGPKLTAVFFTLNSESPFTNVNQGDIARFKAMAKQLKYQVGSQKNLVISQVSGAYQRLLAARERLRVFQERVLADSYEVARLARRSYEVGQSDITTTLQAQQINVQIRSQYLGAVMEYTQAFADLEQACGRPLQ
jgi:cobalt-zinc-cadmium efflux system outer membrane protein